jgi:hypothetical protein
MLYYFLPGNRPDEPTDHFLDIRAPTVIPGKFGRWNGRQCSVLNLELGAAIKSYGRSPIKMMGNRCRSLSPNCFHVSSVSPQNLHRFTSFGARFLRFGFANDLVLFSLPKSIDLARKKTSPAIWSSSIPPPQ